MNCTVCIFGELSSGYTQYPEDSTSLFLKKLYPLCKATTQIAIHRDNSLMYYCYIRKLKGKKYIGLCIAVNGFYISKIESLFSLFESTIEKIAKQGSFIHYADDGSLTSSATALKNEEEEIDTLFDNLMREFETLGSIKNKLPQIDYSVAIDSIKEFSVLSEKHDIVKASYTYGFTFIYKDKDYNTIRINSYSSILNRLHNENAELQTKNLELMGQISRLKTKQRNTLWVGFLSVVVAILCGILYFKVINPSEVTRYQTGDFIYYGPLKDKKPNGEGVAFYPKSDVYGRRYYIGNFINGERQDTSAMLYYLKRG